MTANQYTGERGVRDWRPLEPLIRSTVDARARVPAKGRALLDQSAAWTRDALDHVGISVTDPDDMHTGLTFLRLLVQRASIAAELGHVGDATARLCVGIIVDLAADVIDHLPAEAGA